jgi:hypothetical protein
MLSATARVLQREMPVPVSMRRATRIAARREPRHALRTRCVLLEPDQDRVFLNNHEATGSKSLLNRPKPGMEQDRGTLSFSCECKEEVWVGDAAKRIRTLASPHSADARQPCRIR